MVVRVLLFVLNNIITGDYVHARDVVAGFSVDGAVAQIEGYSLHSLAVEYGALGIFAADVTL